MYKLAITGGIGSGKTTVSNFINENYDSVYLFNADRESKSHLNALFYASVYGSRQRYAAMASWTKRSL